MKTLALILVSLFTVSLLTRNAVAQEFYNLETTGVYGYTSIDYDPSTNVVTAYSETDDYGGALYYYAVTVQLCSGQAGTAQKCVSSMAPNANVTWTNATLTYQGAPGNTYLAQGQHGGEYTTKYSGGGFEDPFGLDQWLSYDIDDPASFPFSPFSEGDNPSDIYIELGDTYDNASTVIPAACGDQRDTIIKEYETKQTPYYPQCAEFSQNTGDPKYTFAALNYGTYNWAILRSYFISKLNALAALNTFQINSAYRNPIKEYQVSTAQPGGVYHPGSRHQYGDAVDVNTNQSTWATYHADGLKLGACVEPIDIQKNSYAHAHLDWRTLATTGPKIANCPFAWRIAMLCVLILACGLEATPKAPRAGQSELIVSLNSSRWQVRRDAFETLLGPPDALHNPITCHRLIALLEREDTASSARGLDLYEDDEYLAYDERLAKVVEEIAESTHEKRAWRALLYMRYAADSKFGGWVADHPEAFPEAENLIHSAFGPLRSDGVYLVAAILAKHPKAFSQSTFRRVKAEIRSHAISDIPPVQYDAVHALGLIGGPEDAAFLESFAAKCTEPALIEAAMQEAGSIRSRL